MRQAGGRLCREIHQLPLRRFVFAVSEGDESSNYRNQIELTQGSIHTDINRNRRQHSEIREPGGAVEIQIDELHQNTKKKSSRAGTFCFLVTLKKHDRCQKLRRKIAQVELAHR